MSPWYQKYMECDAFTYDHPVKRNPKGGESEGIRNRPSQSPPNPTQWLRS